MMMILAGSRVSGRLIKQKIWGFFYQSLYKDSRITPPSREAIRLLFEAVS
ncbi:MAG: hypothetical protein R2880_08695 [Deinococcales bacterium]